MTPERIAELKRARAIFERDGNNDRELVLDWHDLTMELVTDRLLELAAADAEGRCWIAPCDIGDEVFYIRTDTHPRCIAHEKVIAFKRGQVFGCNVNEWRVSTNMFSISFDDIYLTREQAEAALEAMKNAQ